MHRPSLLLLVLALGCSSSGTDSERADTAPSDAVADADAPGAETAAGCGLPAVPLPKDVGEGCPAVAPRCPATPTSSAKTLITGFTCAFGGTETTCTPVQLPLCVRDLFSIDLAVRNPDAPAGCAGKVDIDALPHADGTHVSWHADELDPVSCMPVGVPIEGTTVIGPCCDHTINIFFPKGKFTFRAIVRTDWNE